jgi:hypothetical protein
VPEITHHGDEPEPIEADAASAQSAGRREARSQTEPAFAHPVEREVARLLDRCALRWSYEPRTSTSSASPAVGRSKRLAQALERSA